MQGRNTCEDMRIGFLVGALLWGSAATACGGEVAFEEDRGPGASASGTVGRADEVVDCQPCVDCGACNTFTAATVYRCRGDARVAGCMTDGSILQDGDGFYECFYCD